MIKSESSTIRWLRGVFNPPTPSQNREIKILRNKLPLTLELKRKYAIVDSSTFKFHYRSAEELLDDFEHYLYTFKGLKKATSKQFMGDVKSIWMCVHPNLNLHPNQLVETEFLEYRFFMLEKVKLVENKDKEPEDQTRQDIYKPVPLKINFLASNNSLSSKFRENVLLIWIKCSYRI